MLRDEGREGKKGSRDAGREEVGRDGGRNWDRRDRKTTRQKRSGGLKMGDTFDVTAETLEVRR